MRKGKLEHPPQRERPCGSFSGRWRPRGPSDAPGHGAAGAQGAGPGQLLGPALAQTGCLPQTNPVNFLGLSFPICHRKVKRVGFGHCRFVSPLCDLGQITLPLWASVSPPGAGGCIYLRLRGQSWLL